jgi:hypothetical protein
MVDVTLILTGDMSEFATTGKHWPWQIRAALGLLDSQRYLSNQCQYRSLRLQGHRYQ